MPIRWMHMHCGTHCREAIQSQSSFRCFPAQRRRLRFSASSEKNPAHNPLQSLHLGASKTGDGTIETEARYKSKAIFNASGQRVVNARTSTGGKIAIQCDGTHRRTWKDGPIVPFVGASALIGDACSIESRRRACDSRASLTSRIMRSKRPSH